VSDEETLARVMRRMLEDEDEEVYLDVDPEHPRSATIDGHVDLQPSEAEVLYRIRQLARQRADLGLPGDFKPESYRITFNNDGTVKTTLTGTSEASE